MRAILILMIMSLIGCVKPIGLYKYHIASIDNVDHHQTMSMYIDKEFNKNERAIINQVIREWNNALNGYVKIEVASWGIDHDDKVGLGKLIKKLSPSGEGVLMFKINHDHDMLAGMDEGGDDHKLAFVNGLGERGHLFVVIGDTIGTKSLHKILLHEFGHLMGAGHIDGASLMYPYYGWKQKDCIDRFTLLLVAENRDLDINHLNYCSTKQFP